MAGGSDSGSDQRLVASNQKQRDRSKSSTDSSGTTTSTTTPTLPGDISSRLKSEFGNYLANTGNFSDAIGDWEAAGFSPDQLTGFDMWRQAAGPGGIQQTALDELMKTAQGNYLYGGEGFNAAVDAAYRAGVPQTTSQFASSGRDNNFLGTAALNQIYSDAFAKRYGDERNLMQQSQMALPGMSLLPGQTYQDIGNKYQALEQYGMNYPLEQLYPQLAKLQLGATGFAAPFLGTSATGSSNQSGSSTGLNISNTSGTPAYFPGSSTAGLLGAIGSGASAGGMIGGPWGAAAGAGIGAGLSLLG